MHCGEWGLQGRKKEPRTRKGPLSILPLIWETHFVLYICTMKG